MKFSRIVIFAGHFGSGKTNLAANAALISARETPTVLLDADVVNPMFRANDLRALLEGAGLRLIAPELAGTNVEAVAFTAAAGGALKDPNAGRVIIDAGGDGAGAAALGRYARGIMAGEYEMLFVYNRYRPFTATPEQAASMAEAVEKASKLRFTAIASNHNIGRHTSEKDVEGGRGDTLALSKLTGLPVKLEAFDSSLSPAVPGDTAFPVEIYLKRSFDY